MPAGETRIGGTTSGPAQAVVRSVKPVSVRPSAESWKFPSKNTYPLFGIGRTVFDCCFTGRAGNAGAFCRRASVCAGALGDNGSTREETGGLGAGARGDAAVTAGVVACGLTAFGGGVLALGVGAA